MSCSETGLSGSTPGQGGTSHDLHRYQMNSPAGKSILARVRGGDYAHPGEEEAIERVFRGLPQDPGRTLLDVGCGRGGTADYVRRRGFGRVTGVDIDAESLQDAASRFPQVAFVVEDATRVDRHWESHFDLVYLFNSCYAFGDQASAFAALASVARPGGKLWLFDYTRPSRFESSVPPNMGTPLDLERTPMQLVQAGWRVDEVEDLSRDYQRWYGWLVRRIIDQRGAIVSQFGSAWYDYALATYADILLRIEDGHLGGALVRAVRGA